MLRGADADRAVVQLARMTLGIIDQLGQGFWRQLRIDHDHIGHGREQPDRREILQRIVGQLLVERLVRGQRAGGAHQQGVAVRGGVRGRRGADIAAGAGAVVDHEGLSERGRHAVEQDARDHVAGAAAGKRHEHLDRAGGIVLRSCRKQPGGSERRARTEPEQ